MNEVFSSNKVFGIVDYVVFGALIFVSIAIGIYFAFRDKRRNTSLNYFLGNRQLKALPLGISFVVTFQSSIMMLGYPAETYAYGLQYAVQLFGVVIAFLLAAVIVVPLIHPLGVTSVYEYYNLRYGNNLVRYLGVALGVSYYTLYLGVVLFGQALALKSTAGLPIWLTIVVVSSASIIYTSIGGIKAVVWTDVFQSIVMIAGILAVVIKSCVGAGGLSNIAELGNSRFNKVEFNPDPTIRNSFWTLVIGIIPQMFYIAITQAGAQRIISTPNAKTAKRMFYIAAPIISVFWLLVFFEGLAVFAYHSAKSCDPFASGKIENLNEIIPYTILEMFHMFPGMPGLFIAALSAASLSTLSSGLSSLATVFCVDFLKIWKPNIKDNNATNISKVFVLIIGLISTASAFLLSSVKGPLGEITAGFTGAVAGPETGMFLVSAFYSRSRSNAVFIAAVLGLFFNLWIILGQTFTKDLPLTPYLPPGPTYNCQSDLNNETAVNSSLLAHSFPENYSDVSSFRNTSTSTESDEHSSKSGLNALYSISYMYIQLVGTLFTIVVAVILSLLTPGKGEHVNQKYLVSPWVLVPSFLRRCGRDKQHVQRSSLTAEEEEMIHKTI